MPTYLYRRADGSTFEVEHKITEPALKTCPTTNQPVTRLITGGAGLVFKGSGFYLTDYGRKGKNSSSSSHSEPSRTTANVESPRTEETSAGSEAKSPGSASDPPSSTPSGDSPA